MHTTLALLAATALTLPTHATAQDISGRLQPIMTPVKDAGTYHLSTGTWSRAESSAALAGPEVLYDNTCTTGYYAGLDPGDVLIDSGRIPSTSSGGLFDDYAINGFTLSYCSYEAVSIDFEIAYWDCFEACMLWSQYNVPPDANIPLLGMPAGGPSGTQGCWLVTIDLANTSLGFELRGDCDGGFDNVPGEDSFSWGFAMPPMTSGTISSGPTLGGDPALAFNSSCGGVGDGTTFPGFNSALDGTGLGNLDQFTIRCLCDPGGCYWFGGYSGINGNAGPGANPWSGFYLELQGEQGSTPGNGNATCDGASGSCPCGTVGAVDHGCPNSNPNGLGAELYGAGEANTLADSFQLGVRHAPSLVFGLVLSGKADLSPGISTIPDSAGLLCVGGQTLRGSAVLTNSLGFRDLPDFQGQPYGQASNVSAGTLTVYTFWYRDPGTACAPNDTSASDFNFSNAWAVTWL